MCNELIFSELFSYDLQSGEVLLPPEVGSYSLAEGSQEVVGVHDNVDEGVHESQEYRLLTCADKE